MEDAVVLKPRTLGPSLRVEFNCLNIAAMQDCGETCTLLE